MARFRKKSRSRGRFGGFVRKAKRYGRSSAKGTALLQIDSMAYGAVRDVINAQISPFTSKIPLGAYADEVGMGLANWWLSKNTSGIVRDIAIKGLVIENYNVGRQLSAGFLTGAQTTTNDTFLLG